MANGEEEERTYAVKGDGHGGINARPTNGADTRSRGAHARGAAAAAAARGGAHLADVAGRVAQPWVSHMSAVGPEANRAYRLVVLMDRARGRGNAVEEGAMRRTGSECALIIRARGQHRRAVRTDDDEGVLGIEPWQLGPTI